MKLHPTKPSLIIFLSTSCPHCVKFQPVIKAMQNDHKFKKYHFIILYASNKEHLEDFQFYQVNSVPSIKMYFPSIKKLLDYKGPNQASTILKALQKYN